MLSTGLCSYDQLLHENLQHTHTCHITRQEDRFEEILVAFAQQLQLSHVEKNIYVTPTGSANK